MWKNFQEAFENRVRTASKRADKHDILKASGDALEEMFGAIGKENIKVEGATDFSVSLSIKNSLWASEMRLSRVGFVKKVNAKLRGDFLKRVIIKKL